MAKSNRSKKKVFDVSDTLLYGKIPPQSRMIEHAIIGTLVIKPYSITSVNKIIDAQDFYVEANQIIYSAILHISKEDLIDEVLLVEYLKRIGKLDEVGGSFAILKIIDETKFNENNIENYCYRLKELSMLRKLISSSGEILVKAFNEENDFREILSSAQDNLKEINNDLNKGRETKIEDVADAVIQKFDKKVQDARNNIVNTDDVYTHMPDWDRVNGALFNGLYIVAARPAMGKGVHMTELICRMAASDEIGVINGEMTNQQLLTRIGCNLLSLDNFLWKKNPAEVTDQELELVHRAMAKAKELHLHLEDTIYIDKIESIIRYWVEFLGVKCILADFLTMFSLPDNFGRNFNEVQRVNYILGVFKDLAKNLGVPIILYAQLNREMLKRNAKRPNLGDLKQSGSIEEFAFQVSFLHRPEYYEPDNVVDEFGENIKGLCYQYIDKHRDGDIAIIKHKAILQCSQMKEWDFQAVKGFTPSKDVPF